ncbi:hypothetical protein P7C71_g5478, partial [Lecanoromycetidae sp. Uapishka_2]
MGYKTYLDEQIAADTLLEIELMVLALAAGINDATTYPDYRVFASNQTGNTVLLAVGALGLVDEESLDLRNVGVSLGLFIVGGALLGQLGFRFGRTRRAWLLCTNILQTILVFLAAALRQWVATDTASHTRFAVIALLAFASGAQVAMARTVNVPEITTAMVTSAYIDFLVDPKLLLRNNRPRNRRLFFVLALLTGSFAGAVAYKKVGAAFSLLLAGICKTGLCIMLLYNCAETGDAEERGAREAVPQAANRS